VKPADMTNAAFLPRTKTHVIITHADWDHLASLDFALAHDLSHARLRSVLDDVRDDIDFLDSLQKDINVFGAGTENNEYLGFDILISSTYPANAPSLSFSGTFGVGKTTAIAAMVGSFRASAITLVAEFNVDILTAAIATSSRFTPVSRDESARLEAQKRAEELKREIAWLLSLSRFLHSTLVSSLRRFGADDFSCDTLLRECPWHLFHGTHPPEIPSAFAAMKARGFATA